MFKKKTKKQLSTTERHLGVVLGNIDSKLDLVVEGQENLDEKIDRVESNLSGDIENFKRENKHEHEAILDELRIIRNELKEKAGRDELLALEKRVILLERKFSRGHA